MTDSDSAMAEYNGYLTPHIPLIKKLVQQGKRSAEIAWELESLGIRSPQDFPPSNSLIRHILGMNKKKRKPPSKAVRLTERERYLIIYALKIASEDESIYGGAEADAEMAKVNAEIEAIESKLS